jgi:hypothetical protein
MRVWTGKVMIGIMGKQDEHKREAVARFDADWAEKVSTQPGWDQDFADELIGAIVVVGIAELEDDGTVIEESQIWGMVEAADPDAGIEVELHGEYGGQSWVCPPDLEAFEPARPGIYTLETTGEQIVDPDFTASWTILRSEMVEGEA